VAALEQVQRGVDGGLNAGRRQLRRERLDYLSSPALVPEELPQQPDGDFVHGQPRRGR
jgi:hypothetical protein